MSSSSNEYHATVESLLAASHVESKVVFPNPGGAETMVTLARKPRARRVCKAGRATCAVREAGGWSLVDRMDTDIRE